jgi:hypothetical protein
VVGGLVPSRWRVGIVAGAVAVVAALLVACGSDGSGSASATQEELPVLEFQAPTDPGPRPFAPASDVRGPDTIQPQRVGEGPYGGTGSDLVCDRELLIDSLEARPGQLREWARVLGLAPDLPTVGRYIQGLKPVTLIQDTRVTNHTYESGAAVPFQAILQAGTAVLVNDKGVPVARCRCGNPLLEPIFYPRVRCNKCPPRYTPPPPCEPYSECYRPYPRPPIVIVDRFPPEETQTRTTGPVTAPPPAPTPAPAPAPTPAPAPAPAPAPPPEPVENPSAFWQPNSAIRYVPLTLYVSGFAPNATLSLTTTWPNGFTESGSLTVGPDGSGQSPGDDMGTDQHPDGTYTTVVTNPATGASATATVEIVPG